ncbi:MAG: LytR C-terminal domain-containing protein [Solirubrobacteraceae bacterium]
MQQFPLALSIHKFISSIGADVGFASLIAVALLVLLYFAQARETATLRERLEEAQARDAGLEARLAPLLTAQAATRARPQAPAAGRPGNGQPPVVAPPAGLTPASGSPVPGVTPGAPARPGGSSIPSVRRIPSAAATAAGATTASTGWRGPTPAAAPAAPLGVGAPALASATKLISGPVGPVGPLGPLGPVGPGPVGPVASVGPLVAPFVPSASTQMPPGVAARAGTGSAASAFTAPRPPAGPGEPELVPPRVQLFDRTSEQGEHPFSAGRPILDADFARGYGEGRWRGRLMPILISGIAAVVIVVAVIVILGSSSSSGGSAPQNHAKTPSSSPTGTRGTSKPVPFSPAKFKVAVLNGTTVTGLAADVCKVLTGDGYAKGNVTNATIQTQSTSIVYYRTGAGAAANKIAARHVASALKLAASVVTPATANAIQACSTSATGVALGSCKANVIVSVGANRANLAPSAAG